MQIANYRHVTRITYKSLLKTVLALQYVLQVKFARQYAFQLLGRKAQVELPLDSNRYAPRFLWHHDGYRVAVLRYAHGGAVAQT